MTTDYHALEREALDGFASINENGQYPVLPQVVIAGRPLREVTADTLQALVESNDPPEIFTRSGALARVRAYERA